jgi:hypothetical protein
VAEAAASPLASWESFYVIVGSSAAALIGLQFVVIALLAETRRSSTMREIDAFGTPTIIHFGAALLIAAILSAPWPSLRSAGIALALCGSIGVGYAVVVIRRARSQTNYTMVTEDWVWFVILPLVAYAALLAAAIALGRDVLVSLFVVAATALLLLFIGIHNAWDTVTFITLDHLQARHPAERTESENGAHRANG